MPSGDTPYTAGAWSPCAQNCVSSARKARFSAGFVPMQPITVPPAPAIR